MGDQRDHQIGLLIDAIRDIGVAAGVLREDIEGMSGPEALMFAAETAAHVRALVSAIDETPGGSRYAKDCARGLPQVTAYTEQHDPDDHHCITDPCMWHPAEQRIHPSPRYSATLAAPGEVASDAL